MKSKSVAVLDIRSSEICAVVGERGVNNTFIIKSKFLCGYDGYAEGQLIDVKSFQNAVEQVVKSTFTAVGNSIKVIHVGIPNEFLKLVNCENVLSFNSPKKISTTDISNLTKLSQPKVAKGYTRIKNNVLYYILSDKRRIVNPVGEVSDSLKGVITFYDCKTSFIECLVDVLDGFSNVTDLDLIPSNLAETNYLLEPERRDAYAVLFDLGYISSTFSVACGNGIIYSESFSVGIGHIAVHLMNELNIPYDVATQFMQKVNLNAKEKLTTIEECRFEGKLYSFSTATLRNLIREGLDGICETIEECRQSFTGKDLSTKPIYITGEGVKTIRGAAEHLSSRLVSSVEVISPRLPFYDKPHFSSLFSLLSASLSY